MKLCTNFDCFSASLGECEKGKQCKKCTMKGCGHCTKLKECISKTRTEKGRETRFCKDFICTETMEGDCLCEKAYHCGGCAMLSVCEFCVNYDNCLKDDLPKYSEQDGEYVYAIMHD